MVSFYLNLSIRECFYCIVIGTGRHSFMGKIIDLVGSNDDTAHLQIIMGRIGMFCIGCIVVFLVAQILVM